ncbi:MAG: sigma-54-dependent Fis family transcriptional regulator [Planctomycetaceae bacterium]|nr:sigma-54-dependent Fis family transcriptional regulator [Planctomycetaceae bacterium]
MSAASCCKLRVLFVDDEPLIRQIMATELPDRGHDVTVCEDGASALKALAEKSFDCAILDLQMPGLSGWEVAARMKEIAPDTLAIIHTAHGSMDAAIQALRMRVFDFLPKPCSLFDLDSLLLRVAEHRTLMNKTIALEKSLKAVQGNSELIGDSAPMQRVKRLIDKIAPTDSSVLILGETGTGKELVARRIHDLSPRASMPFVAVNCGALPEQLVESEFFGHRKGAFTGAEISRKGLLEVADGGTLFLDELGELDRAMQVKLLRFLESGEVRRVGENEAFHVDVRIVCATNRPLTDMIDAGTFREDLFFRINTFEVPLPSLRDRKDDIPALAQALIARHLKRRQAPARMLPQETVDVLMNHDWPGNVRELANALEHAVILSDGQTISPEDLPSSLSARRHRKPQRLQVEAESTVPISSMTLQEMEREMILATLERNAGDKPKTAAELGIALKTLYNKLDRYGLRAAAPAGEADRE